MELIWEESFKLKRKLLLSFLEKLASKKMVNFLSPNWFSTFLSQEKMEKLNTRRRSVHMWQFPKLLRMEDMTNPIEGDMRAFKSMLSSEISSLFHFHQSDLRLTHPSFSPVLFETKRTWTWFSFFSHFT